MDDQKLSELGVTRIYLKMTYLTYYEALPAERIKGINREKYLN